MLKQKVPREEGNHLFSIVVAARRISKVFGEIWNHGLDDIGMAGSLCSYAGIWAQLRPNAVFEPRHCCPDKWDPMAKTWQTSS